MGQERWQKIKRILLEAEEMTIPKREAWLKEICEGDEELLADVRELLEADAEQTSDLKASMQAPAHPMAGDLSGMKIGTWRLLRPLGAGGMGSVWLADRADAAFRMLVAVKLINSQMAGPEIIARFKRERQMLADLKHPHIAVLHDGGTTEEGYPYLVMEYVDGKTIDQWCQGWPVARLLEPFRQVCLALSFAHERGVVHRDIKPANIMVDSYDRVKLMDFGIASQMNEKYTVLTQPGFAPMTPAYASPERLRGAPATAAADVYALGLVLLKLITAINPMDTQGDPIAAFEHWHQQQPNKYPELENLLRQMLAWNPEKRASCRQVILIINSMMKQQDITSPPSPSPPTQQPERIPTATVLPFAELEMGLYRKEQNAYMVDLRLKRPDSDVDHRLLDHNPSLVIDFNDLLSAGEDPAIYGKRLSEILFAEKDLAEAITKARATTEAANMALRFRLYIGAGAPELHRIRWETLWDLKEDAPMFIGERLSFSRFLSGSDWRPVSMKRKAELRTLALIANPSNLDEYDLAPIDVDEEVARIKKGLGDTRIEFLTQGQATVDGLRESLRQQPNILFLVCHGNIVRGEPWLWLENAQGQVERISGHELMNLFRSLEEVPRLIVLVSCESAGTLASRECALSGLGPRLAEVGIPAVLCMQGKISMETMGLFLPTFFDELRQTGYLERAVAVARTRVAHRPDWWMAALFSRLRSGKLWYSPGFTETRMEKWPALVRHIRKNRCTPILGPDLTDHFFGSRAEIAHRWAETYHFPLGAHNVDLPKVAQYLSIHQDPMFPYEELAEVMQQTLHQRFSQQLGQMDGVDLEESLEELSQLGHSAAMAPFRILAELDLPIYITADPSPLLEIALREKGRRPRVELCRWHKDLQDLPSVFEEDPDYEPSSEEPLVFRLFGNLEDVDTMVLTEDNYFDFLIVSGGTNMLPSAVSRALADSALMFLGFKLSSWDFRVLFRGVMRQEGRARRRKYAHVGVQIDPEEMAITEPERARKYLESYFGDANISIYWGNADDFLDELKHHL